MYEAVVRERLPPLMDEIRAAAERSGRRAEEITLVAVTKGHPVEAIRAVLDAGLRDVGENRVEALESRQDQVGRAACRWHLIGRLQRRKAPRVLERVDLLHSLDGLSLAEKISRVAQETGQVDAFPVLVQVNTSGEETKGGLELEGAEEGLGRILEVEGLDVRGLMTMAPWTSDEGVLRRGFRRLRELSERVRAGGLELGPELSMGMTNDYPIAVEEGSTMVRLGTALLGERPG